MVNRIDVLKTLLYFDIFNFPPNRDELWHFLEVGVSRETFFSNLSKLKIQEFNSFFYLKNKKNIPLRIKKKRINELKLKKAYNVIAKLRFVPTVKFIGISGSLAMKNSEKSDDIDLFVITSANLVWLTRLICVFILISLGVYRNSKDKKVTNKICLNYLISENALRFNKESHNLYLAHEIGQMLPILDVDKTYQKFIYQNKWIYNFLPNLSYRINSYEISYKRQTGVLWENGIKLLEIVKIEKLVRELQRQYMSKKVTREKISNNTLAFHPINYEFKILSKYRQSISKLK